MGARKQISAEKRTEALKTMYFAKLQNVPTSPSKMRLVADMIRGMEVNLSLIHIYRSGADFFEVVRQMKDVLGANPCPIVVPIGAEAVSYTHLDVYKRQSVSSVLLRIMSAIAVSTNVSVTKALCVTVAVGK